MRKPPSISRWAFLSEGITVFQTELIIFIQSISSDFWTLFFKFWTEIGYLSWIRIVVLLVLFGLSFRAGFILLHTIVWNGLITMYVKDVFALPRPWQVDVNVQLLGQEIPNPALFRSMGAKSFFGGIPHGVIEVLRENPLGSWGFPSGHTSNAVALWGSLSLFLKKAWVGLIAIAMIIFIPLSRMYLGVHFLADILAGYLIGVMVVLLFYKYGHQNAWYQTILNKKLGQIPRDAKTGLFLLYLLVLPFLLLPIPGVQRVGIAVFIGANFGYALLWIRGIPKDTGTVGQRLARIGLALVIYLGSDFLFKKGTGFFISNEPDLVEFLRYAVTTFLLLWGSTEVSIKLGLFQREISSIKS